MSKEDFQKFIKLDLRELDMALIKSLVSIEYVLNMYPIKDGHRGGQAVKSAASVLVGCFDMMKESDEMFETFIEELSSGIKDVLRAMRSLGDKKQTND